MYSCAIDASWVLYRKFGTHTAYVVPALVPLKAVRPFCSLALPDYEGSDEST